MNFPPQFPHKRRKRRPSLKSELLRHPRTASAKVAVERQSCRFDGQSTSSDLMDEYGNWICFSGWRFSRPRSVGILESSTAANPPVELQRFHLAQTGGERCNFDPMLAEGAALPLERAQAALVLRWRNMMLRASS